jgi:protein-L-isoaspartate(D-aspartate) O-methyltransferase
MKLVIMEIQDGPRHQGLRRRLVEALKIKGIKDENVLEAIGKVPRHLFMESTFLQFAYKDQAFPIAAGQTISQPYTVAFQTFLLDVKKNDKILEIGTGSGYQAAVLLEMGARVFTVERQRELYMKALQLLPHLGYNAFIFLGDGYKGLPSYSPFDKIIVTAAALDIPEELKFQLKTGGKLVIPVGNEIRQEMYLLNKVSDNEFITEKHGNFVFVPLLKGIVNS